MTKGLTENTKYRIAPGAELLRLEAERLAIKSPHASVVLTGDSAQLFETGIAPHLDGTRTVSQIADMCGLPGSQALADLLAQLNGAGLLLRGAGQEGNSPFLDFLESAGLEREQTEELLGEFRIAVFGGGKLANAIAGSLRGLPVKTVALFTGPDAGINHSGVTVVQDALEESAILDALKQFDFVVSAFGDAFPAIDHRINRCVHALGTPTLFCRVGLGKCVVGPMVFPYETTCFTCWQMRVAANATDFAVHMAYEERTSVRDEPAYDPSSELDYLTQIAAGEAVNEILKTKLAVGRPESVDQILEYEPFKSGWRKHPILRRPDCPVCSKKKSHDRPEQPGLGGLDDSAPGDLMVHIDSLVSPSTGIIRSLSRVHKDLSEPKLPYIWRAELANHRFLEDAEQAQMIASGKGFTHDAARLSAVGEAVERYASSSWGDQRLLLGSADRLDMPILDPARLVLYRAEQYQTLNYHPYHPDAELGWVPMRSLASDQEQAVSALGVLMAYETSANEPFLFPITSNGLAAGANLPRAVLAGAYEVIERDAFLATWLNKLPCTPIDPSDHPDPRIRSMITTHARRGIALELFEIYSDCGVHVFIGTAFTEGAKSGMWGDGPAVVVGLGADHDPVQAAAGALIEACQVRPSLRMRLRLPETAVRMEQLMDDPQSVTELEDHDLLYTSPEMLGQFDFLRSGPPERFDWHTPAPDGAIARLESLTEALEAQGTDLLYADLTTSDVATVGASVARVVIPDYQPMHFGFAERRLAATRLYAIPTKLGRPATSHDTLNPFPHPLA